MIYLSFKFLSTPSSTLRFRDLVFWSKRILVLSMTFSKRCWFVRIYWSIELLENLEYPFEFRSSCSEKSPFSGWFSLSWDECSTVSYFSIWTRDFRSDSSFYLCVSTFEFWFWKLHNSDLTLAYCCWSSVEFCIQADETELLKSDRPWGLVLGYLTD